MLKPREQTHICYDSYILLEARIGPALNLDVLLLLTWTVWLEIDVNRAFRVPRCTDVLQLQLLLVLGKEDHGDQLTAKRNISEPIALHGDLAHTGLGYEYCAKIYDLGLHVEIVASRPQLFRSLLRDHVDLALEILLLFMVGCWASWSAVF